MTLGEYLKQQRKLNRLNLLQVSNSIGVSVRHILFIESNKRKPSLNVLEKLCKLYKINKISTFFLSNDSTN